MTTRVPRSAHPYYMYDMISQQPQAIERVVREETPKLREVAKRVHALSQVYIVGIGTSWHATLVGEHLFRLLANRHDVRAVHSFEFATHPPPLSPSSAVIVLSHRGTKMYSAQSLEIAKSHGAFTTVVTSIGSGARADLCDYVIETSEGEQSSAFTVSHTCAMTALIILAAEIGVLQTTPPPAATTVLSLIHTLPQIVADVLKSQEGPVKEWVHSVKDKTTFFFTAYGINVSNTYEAALKIKEACYTTTEGFQVEQYLHGPICVTDTHTHVTLLNHKPDSAQGARGHAIMRAALDIGAGVCVVAPSHPGDTLQGYKFGTLTLPHVEEAFVPIVYLLPLQLFTYWLALDKGADPDVFRKNDEKYASAFKKMQL